MCVSGWHPSIAVFFANSHNQLASPIRLKLHLALNEDLARHERGSVGNCEILMMFV